MDSDYSEELFTDDEVEQNTKDFSPDSCEDDDSFVGCSQTPISCEYSPFKAASPTTAEIPSTPLGLYSILSNEPGIWTADLETPERSNQAGPAPRVDGALAVSKNDPTTPTADEIIPASQYVSKRRVKKRPSRRILANISNESINVSKFDKRLETQDVLGIIGEVDKEIEDIKTRLSPIAEHSQERDDPYCKPENKSNIISSLAERVRQLRQSQKRLLRETEYVVIADSDFTKSLKLLECDQQFVPEPRVQSQREPHKVLGLVPFSAICANDDKELEEALSNVVTERVCEDNGFQGFPIDSQHYSQEYASNFQYFLHKIIHQELRTSSKSINLRGFTSQEAEESISMVQRFESFYTNYVNTYHPLEEVSVTQLFTVPESTKVSLPPLIISVNSGFNTAAGEEILLNMDTIIRSKSLLLKGEDNLSECSIDELLKDNTNDHLTSGMNTIPSQCTEQTKEPYVLSYDTQIDIEPEAEAEPEIEHNQLDDDKTTDLQITQSKSCLTKQAIPPIVNGFKSQNMALNLGKEFLSKTEADVADNIDCAFTKRESNTMMETPDVFVGFKTARGTNVKISEEALQRATKIFDEEKDLADNQLKNLEFTTRQFNSIKSAPPRVEGLKTAHSSNLKMPDDTPPGPSKIIDNKNDFADNYQLKCVKFTKPELYTKEQIPNVFDGFKTARGTNVKVSDEALQRANKIFAEASNFIDDHLFKDIEFTVPRPRVNKQVSPSNEGFKTARGVNIKISNDALQRATKIFDEEQKLADNYQLENDEFTSLQLHSNKSVISSNKVLKAAHSSNVKVLEETPQAAGKIFDKENDFTDNQQLKCVKSMKLESSTKKQASNVFQGFATARDTNVRVSDEALQRASKLFAEENDSLTANNTPENQPVIGFQTGRGKSVNVSKSALLKAQSAFAKDLEDNPDLSENTTFKHDQSKAQSVHSGFDSSININPSRKRRSDIDDDTPAGRKKARIGPDLLRRKLFSKIEEEEKHLSESFLHLEQNIGGMDRNIKHKALQPAKSVDDVGQNIQNCISKEVRDSIAALLKDEESFDESSDKWSHHDNYLADTNQVRSSWSAGSCLNSSVNRTDEPPSKRSRSFPGSTELIDTKLPILKLPPSKPPSPKHESIPEDIYFDSPFSQELTALNTIEQSREKRSAAILEQERIIESKKTCREKPTTGSLLRLKETNSRISLQYFFGGSSPAIKMPEELSREGIDLAVLSINSSTASSYQFHCVDFYGETFMINHSDGIPLEDEATLIPNENNMAGVAEFRRAFLAMPGVDPSLLPTGWVENHYKWIVWKLASMDRLRSSKKHSPRFLTPDRVMSQLKYRYDREIDQSQRSPLRRILEKDDAPSRRLVLCVSKILQATTEVRGGFKTSPRTIELTDGWYSVPAVTDYAMLDHINSAKVKEGTKLIICGAELLNLEEGRYPLDIPGDVRLKIHTNSTRRARWDTKLGYQPQCGPMRSTLKSINPNGGLIGKLTVAVARVYPILYREKTHDGQFIDRNARCEEKAAIAYERECQSRIDAMCSGAHESKGDAWNGELEDRMRNNLPMRRNVTPIAKFKVADGDNTALITLWSGAEESQSIFRENTCITIRNALASSRRSNELQITAGRYTSFTQASSDTRMTCPKRIFTSLECASMPGFNPNYSELDTVGIVVSTGAAPHGMKNFETVNLAFKNDANDDSSSFYLSILFWQGIASYGFTEITTVGSFVACSNLEWRKNTYRSIPTAFCTERTVLTCNPRQNHLRQAFEDFRARINDTTTYIETCAAAIQAEITKKSRSTPGSRDSTPRSECWTPRAGSSNRLVNSNSTPRNDARKMAIKGRLEKLQCYGPAPSLSPLHLAQTPRVTLDFRSPVSRVSRPSETDRK